MLKTCRGSRGRAKVVIEAIVTDLEYYKDVVMYEFDLKIRRPLRPRCGRFGWLPEWKAPPPQSERRVADRGMAVAGTSRINYNVH
jgi:hypothetical protein